MGMVKTYATLCLAALSLLAACSKEDEKPSGSSVSNDYFTAVITPYSIPGKTYIATGDSSDYSCWANGDAVNINGTSRTVTVSGDADSYTATIDADGIDAIADGYLAAYPAGRVSQNSGTAATFAWPETTCYATVASGAGAGKQSVEAPMVAYTTQRSLAFENVGLLTQFALKQSGSSNVKLKSISLITDQPIRGTYTIAYDGSGWTRTATGLDGYRRVLLCSEPLSLSSTAQSFYLSLPPVTGASTFTVEILLTVDGVRHRFSRTKSGTIGLEAGKCYDFGTLTYNVDSKTLTDHNSIEYTEVIPAGTESDPYPIGNGAEWTYWCGQYAATAGKYYLMDNDITVASAIGEFKGTLDGAGHTVTLTNCALFAKLDGATVKNVTTDGTVQNSQFEYNEIRNTCGSIAGYATGATVSNCINNATITYTGTTTQVDIGGIVGYAAGGTTINRCKNNANITANATANVNLGGIVGVLTGNPSVLYNCVNRGTITNNNTGESKVVGGVVGRATVLTQVYNSYTIGNVGGYGDKGGFAGYNKGTIRNCYYFKLNSASYFCHTNENGGSIAGCYHSCNSTVKTNSGLTPTNCHSLTSATTTQDGASLPARLNAYLEDPGLSGADQWQAYNGITVLQWELQ